MFCIDGRQITLEEKSRVIYRVLSLKLGRIAQLVELLFYTQAVIGSNPVAPIKFIKTYILAGVVQSVRAPACHAGSCEFESRLPRF